MQGEDALKRLKWYSHNLAQRGPEGKYTELIARVPVQPTHVHSEGAKEILEPQQAFIRVFGLLQKLECTTTACVLLATAIPKGPSS